MCFCASSFGVVFLFCRSGTRRDLPSFPTRRSSDLPAAPPATAINRATPGRSLSAGFVVPRTAARRGRSEEHTSELQSLTNLVCRLLLEKKKKRNHPNMSYDKERISVRTLTRDSHTL